VSIRNHKRTREWSPSPPPLPGQVIAKSSALNPVAGFRLPAGGLEWAYRRNEVTGDAGTADVLLLHGLGSSGYRRAPAPRRPRARDRSGRGHVCGKEWLHTSSGCTQPCCCERRGTSVGEAQRVVRC
jgi:hypothetical protein